jgi:hypothetical protein
VGPSTSSSADTSKDTVAPFGPVASSVMSEGTVMTGGVVSAGGGGGGAFTVTVNDAVPVLPASSVAVHCTVVSPTGNSVPEPGSQEIVILPPTSSCVIVPPPSSSVAVPSTLSSAVTV